MSLDINNFEVKVKLRQATGKVLATAEVILGGIIEIKGWRVLQSVEGKMHERFQERIWITPPSYKAGFRFFPVIFINDKILYQKIEDDIYAEYNRLKSPGYHANNGEESINADDIPF